jgi:threonine/homoserine efflux transporter RhtA
MQVASFTGDTNKGDMVHKLVIFTAHACATLVTNWSMAVSYAASTFSVKLMEPVTSALLQKIILKVRLPYLQWISIPIVAFGAILFAQENNTWKLNVSKGTVLAFIFNICLSPRNVYMKKNHISHSKFEINKTHIGLGLFVVFAVGALVLVNIGIAPPGTAKLYFLLLGSSLFHAIYS